MKLFLIILLTIPLSSFYCFERGLVTEKIVFKKKQIGKKTEFTIDVPDLENANRTIILTLGGHGYGFHIVYSNSSEIYYTNDWAVMTSNYENYKTINWEGFSRFNSVQDTVINGIQTNGLCWKEIKKGSDYIGYLNISETNKYLFDQSLLTLKKK
jgi:hypothetical protein